MSFKLSKKIDEKKVFLVQFSGLESRLDPNTYHVRRRSAVQKIKESKFRSERLSSLTLFNKNSVSEISANDIYVGLENVESNTGLFLESKTKENISTALIFKKGQVLFPKLRPYLNKVLYAEFDGICSTEFHVLDSCKVDNRYLSYFLGLNVVVEQTSLLMSGNTLPRLQTIDIKNLLVPIPPKNIQERIIKKMNAAYVLKKLKEAEAQELLDSIDAYILDKLGVKIEKVSKSSSLRNRIFKRQLSEISGGRYDPNFYKPNYVVYVDAIKSIQHQKLKNLVCFSNEVWDQKEMFVSTFPYIEIGEIDLCFGEIKYISKIETSKAPSRAKMIVRSGDILISTTRPSRGAIVRIGGTNEIYIASTGFSIIRESALDVDSTYLYYILRQIISLKQMEQRSSGGNYPAITQEELGNLIVPTPDLEKQLEISAHITDVRKKAKKLQSQANDILEEAKKEVEKIILTKWN